jgi:copper chaperone CopZ
MFALLALTTAANAQVKSISVRAEGVLCLSCAHRLEKAIQRVDGVSKVTVAMEPVRAEVTPRGGTWIDPERLRGAIKNAGFRPGDVRCTISGPLTTWHGQPAIRLAGSDRVIVLEAAPEHPDLLAKLQQQCAGGSGPTLRVEGQFAGRVDAQDAAAPAVAVAALRAERVATANE